MTPLPFPHPARSTRTRGMHGGVYPVSEPDGSKDWGTISAKSY